MQINTQQKNQKENKTEKLFFYLRSGFSHRTKIDRHKRKDNTQHTTQTRYLTIPKRKQFNHEIIDKSDGKNDQKISLKSML
jgi:hypothetical protein